MKPVETASNSELEDLIRAIKGRRSIRRYVARPVSGQVVDALLEAASAAPSAHNRQPWRFGVLDREARQAIAEAMGRRLEADRRRDGDDPEAIRADFERSRSRITGAPAAILACLTMDDMDRYPDANRQAAERHMAIQGTAMAVQNLLLAAHASGLAASWLCAPLFCPDTVRTTLRLPQSWEPQALVTVGYPANSGRPYSRRPLSEVVRNLSNAS